LINKIHGNRLRVDGFGKTLESYSVSHARSPSLATGLDVPVLAAQLSAYLTWPGLAWPETDASGVTDRAARADVGLLIRLEGMAGKASWLAGVLCLSGRGASHTNVNNCDNVVYAAISAISNPDSSTDPAQCAEVRRCANRRGLRFQP
jgi:hypothetical protein